LDIIYEAGEMRALMRMLPSTRREEKHDDEQNMIDD